VQLDAVDLATKERIVSGGSGFWRRRRFKTFLQSNESLSRLLKDRKGSAYLEIRPGSMNGRQPSQRPQSALLPAASCRLIAFKALSRGEAAPFCARPFHRKPTDQRLVDFCPRVFSHGKGFASVEASDKPENAVTFTSVSEAVRCIATWIPASKQVLDDLTGLMSYLQVALPYYVDLEEELQMLSGDGTSEFLHGLIPQASAFNTSLTHAVAGWNTSDIIGRAIEQILTAKELVPTFLVINPIDYYSIRLQKDAFWQVYFGRSARASRRQDLVGLNVVVTTNISSGTFLIGSGSLIAAEIRDRMSMQVEIATQHASFFPRI